MSQILLSQVIEKIHSDVEALLSVTPVLLGIASPPNTAGVYMLLVGNEVVYIGEAKGSQGLRDRLLRKHTSGDDSHACQRAYKETYPDRLLRREHIKANVSARWLAIAEPDRVSLVERLLIYLYKPRWNRK